MIKRFSVYLILFCMTLHCACRIGFISYLYQQRHHIALSMGLIEEVPITVCSHEYIPAEGLYIQVDNEQQNSLPVSLLQVREITLFFDHINTAPGNASQARILGTVGGTNYQSHPPQDIPLEIFQPPKI